MSSDAATVGNLRESVHDAALAGLRVVDFGQYLAGPLVAMLLADLGADVVRVDPPGGPCWSHDANAVLQRGKRSIVLDLKEPSDNRLAQKLVDRADIVIEGFRPGVMTQLGLDPQECIARNPRLVYLSLPGFAHDDPRAQTPAWEGVLNAAVGVFETLPGFSQPTFNALPVASNYGAMVAAHSVMAALIARERDGRGQWLEVALFDAAFEAIGQRGESVEGIETIPYRPTRNMPPQMGHYRCADGQWLHLCLIQDRHLQWFGRHFMPPEWIADGMTDNDRLWNDADLIPRARARFAELFKTRTALEWEHAINKTSGAPSAICATSEQWLIEDTHARGIGAVAEVDDPELGATWQAGHPVSLSATPARVQFPRRRLDEDRQAIADDLAAAPDGQERQPRPPRLSQALAGVRVVDLTQVLAGPTSTRVLAEYGADVIKVQNASDNQLRYHLYGNSGKRSIILNLKSPDGRAVLNRMIDGVDIFVENFALGVAERLGAGEADIRRHSPDVVYASVSAYGRGGYRGGWRGREELGQAITGMEVRWGGYGPDDEPLQGPMTFTDSGAGLYGAFAMLVGLFHRLRTGVGQRVESSLAHAATFEQIPFMIAYPGRVWDEPNGLHATGWHPLDRLYPTADHWLYLAATRADDRARLTSVEGLEDLTTDDAAVEAQLIDRLARDTADAWVQRMQNKGIGAHRALTVDEVMEDSISKARGLSVVREHPGVGLVRNPGPTARLQATPARLTFPAPAPGLQSRALLEEFGFAAEADDLIARGVVGDRTLEGVELFGRPR